MDYLKNLVSVIRARRESSPDKSYTKKLLMDKGFKDIKLEKEKGFEKTKLVNIYARK